MTNVSVLCAAAAALFATLAHVGPALAQASAGAASAGAPASKEAPEQGQGADDDDYAKEEAKSHFLKGLSLMDQQAWAAALAEFMVSRGLYPTRSATINAAICMRNLQRFDEALEMFETLLREFPKLPQEDKTHAQTAIDELRGLVGTVEVTGAKPGASILIDGRNRGDYPPLNPLRVSAGTHTIRVFKGGFAPFETRVDVAGGEIVQVSAKLLVLTESGQLRVSEQSGKRVDVVVDGVVVGQTPWEGSLSVGDHMVVLRGDGNLGTAPAAAPIKAKQLTTLSLRAEELNSILRVDPTPVGATVIVDSVSVGRGTWEGPLRSGSHRVEVRAEGFLPVKKQLSLSPGQQEHLAIALERNEEAEIWKKPAKKIFDWSAGVAFIPSFGGDVVGGCEGDCSRSVGYGGVGRFQFTYEYDSGWGLGASIGYFVAVQSTTKRKTTLTSVGLTPDGGTVNDEIRLNGGAVGGTLSYRIGQKSPFILPRLGAGVLIASARDWRQGTFAGSFETFPVADSQLGLYVYVDPEVRVSFQVSERFELAVGVQALMLFAAVQPRFDEKLELEAPGPSIGTYPNDAITGRFVFVPVPGVSARFTF